ncbi:MAG: hypothetical protein P4L56_04780 [Candidatus Sulfopaludibacter sp.]|nr:hypothetical protein [Candidatus Sulfopaludibacter sp.]
MATGDPVRLQLERILASPQFVAAQRRSRLLRFLVEHSLAGEADDLKESVIACEVFDRSAGHDPKVDSLVRVEMGRLRSRLIEYYADAGKNDAVRIEIPVGSYAPVVTFSDIAPVAPSPQRHSARPRIWAVAYALLLCGVAAALSAWLWRSHDAGQPSIAVLPFLNFTGDPDKDFLGDSITDELTGTLAESGNLRVVARTSSFVFKGRNVDVREIGRALRANSVLEGSISRKADQLGIVAQLIRTGDGYHLWSQSYAFPADDLQKTEGEIVRSVAKALRANRSGFVDASQLMATRNSEAHDLYLRARYTFNRGTLEGTRTGLKLAREAIEIDPGYALPYWLAANAEYTLNSYGAASPSAVWDRPMKELEEALRLDPRFGDAHASHALGVYSVYHDWPRAEEEFRLAIRQGSVTAPSLYGWGLTTRGRFGEAHRELAAAIEKDPLGPGPRLHRLIVYYFEGNRSQAAAELESVLELNPENITALVQLAFGDALVKNCGAEQAELAKLRTIGPRLAATQFIAASTSITCGHPAEARRILAGMEAPDYPGRSFFQMALLDQTLGDTGRMFDHLKKAADNFENAVLYLKVHPIFKPYRSDPRFIALVGQLGL